MKIAVTDASIFIDLLECEACEAFFRLPYTFITSYQVWMELEKDHRKILAKWLDDRIRVVKIERDFVKATDEKELSSSLSIADRSVWFLSYNQGDILLTSDGLLRKMGKKHGIETHGLLWIFDRMVDEDILDPKEAIAKLESVFEANRFYKTDQKLRKFFERLKIKWNKKSSKD